MRVITQAQGQHSRFQSEPDEAVLGNCDVSSEVSALLEMLPVSGPHERLQIEAGLSQLLTQAHCEKNALKQRLSDW